MPLRIALLLACSAVAAHAADIQVTRSSPPSAEINVESQRYIVYNYKGIALVPTEPGAQVTPMTSSPSREDLDRLTSYAKQCADDKRSQWKSPPTQLPADERKQLEQELWNGIPSCTAAKIEAAKNPRLHGFTIVLAH